MALYLMTGEQMCVNFKSNRIRTSEAELEQGLGALSN